jgi:alpha-L-arabinofuranosidase
MDFNPGTPVDPAGYFDPVTGAVLPAIKTAWERMPVNGVRYPGNLEILNWNWSYTIGPFASRIAQPIGPNGSNVQTLKFGFDEFMDSMTVVKGLPSDQVQIMVNLYASVGQPDPAILAADWVEYCNAPDNGSNPRNGTDWASLRNMYGHPNPYGIKIWNIGNEPWQPDELGNTVTGANNFIALAIPIIDSMLAADPTIHITVPAVGQSTSPWNSTLLNSSSLMSRVYGFSSHAFYDNDTGTGNPMVSQVGVWVADLAAAAAAQGKKVIEGDHAHHAPTGDTDKAVRWEGALAAADMLLMLSQISNVELANFWIYGNVKTQWHPIRQNAGGSYTFMAAAQVYEQFDSVFYDQSLGTTISNAAGGGSVPNVRAAAFKSNDGSKASVLAINIDLAVDNELVPPSLAGYNLQKVKLMTAPGIGSDTCTTTVVTPLGNGNYSFPHTSVLMFEYQSSPLAVEFVEPLRVYLVEGGVRIEWASASEKNSDHFEVERSVNGFDFEKIGQAPAQGNSTAFHLYRTMDTRPFPGVNYYRIKQVDLGGSYQYSKVLGVTFNDMASSFRIFPNPVADMLFVEMPASAGGGEMELVFYDVDGKMAMKTSFHAEKMAQVDVSGLLPGVYFARANSVPGKVMYFVKK